MDFTFSVPSIISGFLFFTHSGCFLVLRGFQHIFIAYFYRVTNKVLFFVAFGDIEGTLMDDGGKCKNAIKDTVLDYSGL